jgi:hypothetical protein
VDGDGIIDLDLPALGANPLRKDLFLEIDYMDCSVPAGDCPPGDAHSHRPKVAALDAVVAAFADAPVSNPDGATGITLHVDVSNAIPHRNFLTFGPPAPGVASFDEVKADPANFGTSNPRRFAFHYALFIHREVPGTLTSGHAEQPGNDLLVSYGEWHALCIGPGGDGTLETVPSGDDVRVDARGFPAIYAGPNLVCDTTAAPTDFQIVAADASPRADLDGDGLDDRSVGTVAEQAGTLMHELGHNLNLAHGGGDGFNFKPNYLSIMSYFFQFGIPPTDPDGAGPLRARLDYSRRELGPLVENRLNEPAGIGDGTDDTFHVCPSGGIYPAPGRGPIDWNCNGDSTEDLGALGIPVDVNGDGVAEGTLRGFDDWSHLKFDFQDTGDFADGIHATIDREVEMDYPTSLEIPLRVTIDIKPGDFPNSINPRSRGQIPVAILSSSDFDAPALVDEHSLTFGRSGNEPSLAFCGSNDVNGDGLLDLVCHFHTPGAGFRRGDTRGLLKGRTVEGKAFVGVDSVRVVPQTTSARGQASIR